MLLLNPKASDLCIAFLGNKVSDRTLRSLSGKDAEQENLNVWQASAKYPKSSRKITEITIWDSIFGSIMLKMFVFLCLGYKVSVPFSVSHRRKALSQQEWKALMANFAWQSIGCRDGQRGLTWEQWLKTVTVSLSQKTAVCGHLCCIWSGTLAFPYRLKSV